MYEDFNLEFVDTAFEWYKKHKTHVDELKQLEFNPRHPYVRPSKEDENHPELWRPSHWRWFFENYNME